ncbi:hypothetical protein [Sphingomonas caeni]|uniref:hypothetical protein n=1 Tax=Sphingomonas caeni TaxID=2984949 RepID=UPI002231CF4D|nr:hypothetical protein [Sphingomonas caeni]
MALATAAPAHAQQTGLPVWLVGTWCGELGAVGPRLCDSWAVGEGGTLQNRLRPAEDSGVADDGSTGEIAIEQGRLVMRGGVDGAVKFDFREVSRGPQEVVFENRMDGLVLKFRIVRVGDDLIEDIWIKDRPEPQRTVYHLKK